MTLPDSPTSTEVFDRQAALQYVGNDIEFLRELLEMLHDCRGPAMAQIESAIDNCDASELRDSAHRMKGTLSTFYATKAVETANQLELRGKMGDLESVGLLFASLNIQIVELCESLQSLVDEEISVT